MNKTGPGVSAAEDIRRKGIIFDIKRYAVHDGPGIRTTVFLKGCPLDCRWCHNPEAKSPDFELSYKESRCLKCGECVRACPMEALNLNGRIHVDRERCLLCGDCSAACPTEALEIIGRESTVESVINEIEKDRVFFEESGGGVTFSGGEPLMQPEFLSALLRECRRRDFHVCLDTCGQAPWAVLEGIRRMVDIFLYDLKSVDPGLHKRETGVSNRLILNNLRKLAEAGHRIIIRIPVIPGFNDTSEGIRNIGEYVRSLPGIREVSLLPYHDIAGEKYKRLNKPTLLDGLKPHTEVQIQEIKSKLEDFDLRVTVGS